MAGSVLPAGDAAIISRERGQIGVTANPPSILPAAGCCRLSGLRRFPSLLNQDGLVRI